MKQRYNLSTLPWTVEGFTPELWRSRQSLELGLQARPEVDPIPARVPGSVQQALRDAGMIPDFNVGLEGRKAEWAENRVWIFCTQLPAAWRRGSGRFRLRCMGLDYSGWVLFNGKLIGSFRNTFLPHSFELEMDPDPAATNELQIIFDLPPRWLGQFGKTSQIREWKTRFNYTWDWTLRMVQTGIWDTIELEHCEGAELSSLHVRTDYDLAAETGTLQMNGHVAEANDHLVRVALRRGAHTLFTREFPVAAFSEGLVLDRLPVEPWWPNGVGVQPLYTLRCELVDASGIIHDAQERTLGFKHVEWQSCQGAPAAADPWLCVVNGQPTFLQGVNWTPIRTNYADLTHEDYRVRVQAYADMGCNVLRVWGGAFLERDWFYALCDELGLLVWQELPLSSSGHENYPPEDPRMIEDILVIARSYVERRAHHASLLMWCGGNELTTPQEHPQGVVPCDASHPMLAALIELMAEEDPTHRFIITSPTGPNFVAHAENYGKGVHWDIHGPWRNESPTLDEWEAYWAADDSLFRSEAGCPGASPLDVIERYAGDLPTFPATADNPLWRRTWWWTEWPRFVEAHDGREPATLAEYVEWSQQRQADALAIATRHSKNRFPGIGGIIFWMGHDCFPCTANTSILDFHGRPKPAAIAVGRIFKELPLMQR